ncbi:MAG: ATP-binding protein [Candidatus Micrarchaeaceae archaeon]
MELRNWKAHSNTTMEFRKGTNVLVGIMGAGKSSVMDAISFALFGTFPALKQKRVSLDDIVMNRPEEKKSAEVKLGFSIGSDNYLVSRKIEKGAGSSASLEKNGRGLQTQPERVNEEIEKALGLNYDTFSRAIYAEQNKLDYMLELRKGDRKKQIDEMLNLDRFARAEENTTSLINSIRSAIAEEEQMMAAIDTGSAKKQLDALAKERIATEESIKALEEAKNREEKSVGAYKSRLDAEKKEYEKKRTLADEASGISGRIAALKGELQKIAAMKIDMASTKAEAEKAEKDISRHSAELDSALKEEKDAERMRGELDARIAQNEKRLAEREKLLKKVEGKDAAEMDRLIEEETLKLKEISDALAASKSRKSEEEKWLRELSMHMGTCPLCRRELSDELRKSLIDERERSIKELEASAKRMEAQRKKLEDEIAKRAEERAGLQATLEKLKDYGDVEDVLKKDRELEASLRESTKKAAEKVEELKGRLDELRKAYGEIKLKLDYAKRKETYEKELAENEHKLKEVNESIAMIKVDEKVLYALQDELASASSKLSETASKLQGERKYLETVLKQVDEKAAELAKFEAMKDRISARREIVADLNKFKSSLVDTEALLRSELVQSVNALMQSIWPKLYPYGDFSSLRLSATKDDYVLEISAQSGSAENWVEVESVASGGERSITALALRIALSMVIVPNLRWLILDEPTHNLDRAGIARLIDVLGNTLPSIVEQVFIITHDESLKEISPASIYILDRDKESNGATRVGEIA